MRSNRVATALHTWDSSSKLFRYVKHMRHSWFLNSHLPLDWYIRWPLHSQCRYVPPSSLVNPPYQSSLALAFIGTALRLHDYSDGPRVEVKKNNIEDGLGFWKFHSASVVCLVSPEVNQVITDRVRTYWQWSKKRYLPRVSTTMNQSVYNELLKFSKKGIDCVHSN